MEVLTSILHRAAAANNDFKFHNRCEKLRIINLCFADDLFIFARGDKSSAKMVMDSLFRFKTLSGLVPSMNKSTIYFCNVSPNTKAHILNLMPFEEGALPVRYLGVPLISSRLKAQHCSVLIEKIDRRIDDWKAKFLSFAGRLQLIGSVLSAISSFRAAAYMLPAHVVNQIERKIRGFLWCHGALMAGKAKVSWDHVCLPKSEGGLGIRRLSDVNHALLVGHIHSILASRPSLWVKWIHEYKLKGRSFWNVPLLPNSSWCWRKLLQLRSVVRKFFWVQIGNGRNASLWFDNWHPLCPLADYISPRVMLQGGFNIQSNVAEGVGNGRWNWPNAWHDLFPVLNAIDPPDLIHSRSDVLRWKDGGLLLPLSTRLVWDSIRKHAPVVPWYKIVWFSQAIPRHAFFLWLIFKRKLSTQDRIRRWQVKNQGCMNLTCCLLCWNGEETHQHLFFECSYSKQVWELLISKAGFATVQSAWHNVTAWLAVRAKSTSLKAVLGKLMVAAASYFIWQERNIRFLKNLLRPPETLVQLIMEVISLKLKSMSFKKTPKVTRMLQMWGIDLV